MPPRFIQRLLRQEPAASAPPGRTSVRPPAIWGQAEPLWKAVWDWLRAHPPGHRRLTALDAARQDFADALADIDANDAADLARRGRSARSLRELWHLRSVLYGLLATGFNQVEADRQMAQLNRHFPTRAPRAGVSTVVH